MEEAIEWWGTAGQRSLERSAFVEAVGHFSRALAQIAALPATPALRREEIKLQVALIAPLIHINGFAAPETKAAVDRANLLIERAEAIHEAPEDLLLLFSVLYGLWFAQAVGFNDGDVVLDLATQTLALAERRGATVPLMIGHRLVGTSLLYAGELNESRKHLSQVIDLYDPTEHRPLATRLGSDLRAAALSFRSWVLCTLSQNGKSERFMSEDPDISTAAISGVTRPAIASGTANALWIAASARFSFIKARARREMRKQH